MDAKAINSRRLRIERNKEFFAQKTLDFPTEESGRRRGILKGWCAAQRIKIYMIAGGNHTLIKQPCTEAPLKPASLGTFLPGQESTAPGRAVPRLPNLTLYKNFEPLLLVDGIECTI